MNFSGGAAVCPSIAEIRAEIVARARDDDTEWFFCGESYYCGICNIIVTGNFWLALLKIDNYSEKYGCSGYSMIDSEYDIIKYGFTDNHAHNDSVISVAEFLFELRESVEANGLHAFVCEM